MADPTMGGMGPDPSPGGGGPGWHGPGAGGGWFGKRKFEIDPKTGLPKASRGFLYQRTKFKTRIKRYARKQRTKAKRYTKKQARKQWRLAKKDVRRVRKQAVQRWNRAKKDRARRNATQSGQPTTNLRYDPKPTGNRDPGTGRFVSDGATSICRLGGGSGCGNPIRYNGARGRWEHIGKGNAACFGK